MWDKDKSWSASLCLSTRSRKSIIVVNGKGDIILCRYKKKNHWRYYRYDFICISYLHKYECLAASLSFVATVFTGVFLFDLFRKMFLRNWYSVNNLCLSEVLLSASQLFLPYMNMYGLNLALNVDMNWKPKVWLVKVCLKCVIETIGYQMTCKWVCNNHEVCKQKCEPVALWGYAVCTLSPWSAH